MQQIQPNPPAAPTFEDLVIGTMLGQIGCLVANIVLVFCLVFGSLALLGPQIGNVFSRITNGLGAP